MVLVFLNGSYERKPFLFYSWTILTGISQGKNSTKSMAFKLLISNTWACHSHWSGAILLEFGEVYFGVLGAVPKNPSNNPSVGFQSKCSISLNKSHTHGAMVSTGIIVEYGSVSVGTWISRFIPRFLGCFLICCSFLVTSDTSVIDMVLSWSV